MDDEFETERSQVLFCEECGCESDDDARGHLAQEDDGSVSVAFFCPVCSIEVSAPARASRSRLGRAGRA